MAFLLILFAFGWIRIPFWNDLCIEISEVLHRHFTRKSQPVISSLLFLAVFVPSVFQRLAQLGLILIDVCIAPGIYLPGLDIPFGALGTSRNGFCQASFFQGEGMLHPLRGAPQGPGRCPEPLIFPESRITRQSTFEPGQNTLKIGTQQRAPKILKIGAPWP